MVMVKVMVMEKIYYNVRIGRIVGLGLGLDKSVMAVSALAPSGGE